MEDDADHVSIQLSRFQLSRFQLSRFQLSRFQLSRFHLSRFLVLLLSEDVYCTIHIFTSRKSRNVLKLAKSAFFAQRSSYYETSDSDHNVNRNI